MILDYMNRTQQYAGLFPQFTQAMEFAKSLENKPVGRYELGEIFAMVQEFDTIPAGEKQFELHRNYLDVHIVLSGEEVIEYEDISQLSPVEPYKEESDIQFLEGVGIPVLVKAGMFCLVFVHDGHKPGCCVEKPEKLRKIVLKIPQT